MGKTVNKVYDFRAALGFNVQVIGNTREVDGVSVVAYHAFVCWGNESIEVEPGKWCGAYTIDRDPLPGEQFPKYGAFGESLTFGAIMSRFGPGARGGEVRYFDVVSMCADREACYRSLDEAVYELALDWAALDGAKAVA